VDAHAVHVDFPGHVEGTVVAKSEFDPGVLDTTKHGKLGLVVGGSAGTGNTGGERDDLAGANGEVDGDGGLCLVERHAGVAVGSPAEETHRRGTIVDELHLPGTVVTEPHHFVVGLCVHTHLGDTKLLAQVLNAFENVANESAAVRARGVSRLRSRGCRRSDSRRLARGGSNRSGFRRKNLSGRGELGRRSSSRVCVGLRCLYGRWSRGRGSSGLVLVEDRVPVDVGEIVGDVRPVDIGEIALGLTATMLEGSKRAGEL
jgi:hypothetical protein